MKIKMVDQDQEQITKKDILNNLELIKKVLENIEDYIKNKVYENGSYR